MPCWTWPSGLCLLPRAFPPTSAFLVWAHLETTFCLQTLTAIPSHFSLGDQETTGQPAPDLGIIYSNFQSLHLLGCFSEHQDAQMGPKGQVPDLMLEPKGKGQLASAPLLEMKATGD